jgi:hypothetical protein
MKRHHIPVLVLRGEIIWIFSTTQMARSAPCHVGGRLFLQQIDRVQMLSAVNGAERGSEMF